MNYKFVDIVCPPHHRLHSVAKVVSEHMTRLNALVDALSLAPEDSRLPVLPQSFEPADKKAPVQRHFRSTRRPTKRKQQVMASKPITTEKELLLRSLAGDTAVISSHPPHDHDCIYVWSLIN